MKRNSASSGWDEEGRSVGEAPSRCGMTRREVIVLSAEVPRPLGESDQESVNPCNAQAGVNGAGVQNL